MYSQEETDNAEGMLSSRSILQVELDYWITQWSWSLGMVLPQELICLLSGENRQGWPCYWKARGSSRYSLSIEGGCSCNLTRANMTMKRHKIKKVWHIWVKYMSQLTQVGSLSIRRALDSCSWNELESRYASLEVHKFCMNWLAEWDSCTQEGHDGRLATTMWLTSECKYKQVYAMSLKSKYLADQRHEQLIE